MTGSPLSSTPALTQCIKPTWVHHDSYPILCCDISPHYDRVVTGGADHNIRVWSVAPIVDRESESDRSVARLLATLGNHERAVNAVKFSSDGSMIASCGDGESPAVLVWRRTITDSEKSFSDSDSVDRWTIIAHLRGHTLDVQDLAFDPTGKLLASASVDNSIIVWDLIGMTAVKVLRGHTSWVKGVAWDPLGRYLASFGDDSALIVWDSHDDWAPKKKITDGFLTTSTEAKRLSVGRPGINRLLQQITFSRLSWAPDGQSLAVSRGVSAGKGQFTASHVFTRGVWKHKVSFIGHRHPTTVTRYNPHCWTIAPLSASDQPVNPNIRRSSRTHASSASLDKLHLPVFGVCAVGSMDDTITVWCTHSPKPVAHLRGFFTESIEDLSWSSDGLSLCACSHDGTLAFVHFTEKDFGGRKLTANEMKSHLAALYGEEFQSQSLDVLESPLAIQLHAMGEQHATLAAQQVAKAAPVRAPSVTVTPEAVLAAQQETRRADGKRKLRPVNVEAGAQFGRPAAIVTLPPELAIDKISTAVMATTAAPSSVIAVPTLSATVNSGETSIYASTASSTRSSTNSTISMPSPPVPHKRKRDSESHTAPLSTPGSNVTAKKKRLSAAVEAAKDSITAAAARETTITNCIASQSANTASSPASVTSQIVAAPTTSTVTPAVSSAAASPSSSILPVPSALSPQPSATVAVQRPRFPLEPAPFKSQFLCPLPPPLPTPLIDRNDSAADRSMVQANVTAYCSMPTVSSWTTITCVQSNEERWRALLPHSCTVLTANATVIVCCARDRVHSDRSAMHWLSDGGRRLLPPIQLTAPPVIAAISDQHLAIITADGDVRVINLTSQETVLTTSVIPVLTSDSGVTVSNIRLVSSARPLLTLSDGSSHLFDRKLGMWLLMSDTSYYASELHSLITATNSNANTDSDALSLCHIQRQSVEALLASSYARSSMLSLDAPTRALHTLSHIESQLVCAQSLAADGVSGSDYHRWLYIYIQQLVHLIGNNEYRAINELALPGHRQSQSFSMTKLATEKLTDTVYWLLGSTRGVNSQPTVLDLDKRKLLRSYLPVMAANKQLQRLTTSIVEALHQAEEREARRSRPIDSFGTGRRAPLSLFPELSSAMHGDNQHDLNSRSPSAQDDGGVNTSSLSSSSSSPPMNGHLSVKHAQLEHRLNGQPITTTV